MTFQVLTLSLISLFIKINHERAERLLIMKSVDHSMNKLLIMHEILYIHINMNIIVTPTSVGCIE